MACRFGSTSSLPWPCSSLVLIFIVVPIAELYVIIQVGGAIGVIPTLVLLLLDALLGSMLLRHQGRAAWVRFNRALAENRLPHKEVFDGVLIIFGGALLITPGFITDIFGPRPADPADAGDRPGHLVPDRPQADGAGEALWTWVGHRSFRAAACPQRARAAAGRTGRAAARARLRTTCSAGRSPVAPRAGPRPDDIEGTGHEIRDEDELPPGREPFGG